MTAPGYHVTRRLVITHALPADQPIPIADLLAALDAAQRDYCTQHGCRPDQMPHDWAYVRIDGARIVVKFHVEQPVPREVIDVAATQIMPRIS